jgi:hypothetical protein
VRLKPLKRIKISKKSHNKEERHRNLRMKNSQVITSYEVKILKII